MKSFLKNEKGFSLIELLIVVGIITFLSTIVIMNMRGSETGAKETKLKSNLTMLREALVAFHADHGFFPCTVNDWNNGGNATNFQRQLTWFTDYRGAVSKTRTENYRFGLYLQEFPLNPFYEGTDATVGKSVAIEQNQERILQALKYDIAAGSGTGGWYYEAKSGNIVPNLGGDAYPDSYCHF
jgi:prepilin-type N-terminal cleavage/methylation domain-containing protein